MHIAIYHGFTNMHYEMLGYMYDFFLTNHIFFDIYAHESIMWKKYYDKIFGVKNWLTPNSLDCSKYNYIILLTDDDRNFPQDNFKNFSGKIISIDHCHEIRNGPVLERVCTRPNNVNKLWAIPCYNINLLNDTKLSKIKDKISIAIIGDSNRPINHETLKELFYNFNEIDFHVISYNILMSSTENIHCYLNLDADCMFSILEKCSYILSFMRGKNYITSILTGAIPLAYTTKCKLIIPREAKKELGLKTPLSIEDLHNYKIEPLDKQIINEIDLELNMLIEHRNSTFKKILI